jgi:hypothetical protein
MGFSVFGNEKSRLSFLGGLGCNERKSFGYPVPPPLSSFPSREDEWLENRPQRIALVVCVGYTTTHHPPAVLPAAGCIERFNKLTISTITVNESAIDCKCDLHEFFSITGNWLEPFASNKQKKI